jgi:hypothetical protein
MGSWIGLRAWEVNAPSKRRLRGLYIHARGELVTVRANAIDAILGLPGGTRGTETRSLRCGGWLAQRVWALRTPRLMLLSFLYVARPLVLAFSRMNRGSGVGHSLPPRF